MSRLSGGLTFTFTLNNESETIRHLMQFFPGEFAERTRPFPAIRSWAGLRRREGRLQQWAARSRKWLCPTPTTRLRRPANLPKKAISIMSIFRDFQTAQVIGWLCDKSGEWREAVAQKLPDGRIDTEELLTVIFDVKKIKVSTPPRCCHTRVGIALGCSGPAFLRSIRCSYMRSCMMMDGWMGVLRPVQPWR